MSDRGERETDEGRTQYRHSAASPRKGWRNWPEGRGFGEMLAAWKRPEGLHEHLMVIALRSNRA